MATGVIKEVGQRPFYDYKDVMEMLGVSRSKAYGIIKGLRYECLQKGLISKTYPEGKIPRKYFNQMCMIE